MNGFKYFFQHIFSQAKEVEKRTFYMYFPEESSTRQGLILLVQNNDNLTL